MGDLDSGYSRVVVVRSWMLDEDSWRWPSRGDTARCLMRVSWGRSSRWMQLDDRCGELRSVESLNAAGWSLRPAGVGRVVEGSWMIVAGSWGRSSRWWIDVPVLTVHWVNRGVSIWLLARTACRTWVRCCNARAIRNSESLRGLHATLRERRGRNRCWQLGRVESIELITNTEPCLSTTDQVNGRGNRD